jgi:hypothetical protein
MRIKKLIAKIRERCECSQASKLIREVVDSLLSDEDGWVHRGRTVPGQTVLQFVKDGDAEQSMFEVRLVPGRGSCFINRWRTTVELRCEGTTVELCCLHRIALHRAVRAWVLRYANEVASRVFA